MPSPRNEGAETYRTAGGVAVRRSAETRPYERAIEPLIDALDGRRGVLLASSFEYPGRYTRWDVGFADPPLAIAARDRAMRVTALNERGTVLLPAVRAALAGCPAVAALAETPNALDVAVAAPAGGFTEEERSRQPSVFSLLRALVAHFACPAEG
ncbi:MAG: anthranilate synthase component I, partial [Rhodospirillales bacterium]